MMRKRFLCAILSLLLINMSYAYAAASGFERITELGIVSGYEDGTLREENKVTRAEFLTMLNRATGVWETQNAGFPDVADDAWYKKQIDIAVTAGYVKGYDDNTIRPESNITRQEAAVILNRVFAEHAQNAALSFTDSNEVADWAAGSVAQLANKKYINGYEDNSFRPNDEITRGECMIIFDKIVSNLHNGRSKLENKDFEGNLVLTSSELTLTAVNVSGSVYITPGADAGEIRFTDVNAGGSIVFCGRNGAALVLENTNAQTLVMNGENAKALLCENTKIGECSVLKPSFIEQQNLTGDGISALYAYADTSISADIANVNVAGTCDITVREGAVVDKLNVSAGGKDSEIMSYGLIKELETKSGITVNNKKTPAGTVKNITYADTSYKASESISFSGGGGGGGGGTSRPSAGVIKDITSITVNEAAGGKLYPSFDKSITSYTLKIPYYTEKAEFEIAKEVGAECRAGGVYIDGKYTAENIKDGSNVIVIEVLNNLKVEKRYSIDIIKSKSAPDDKIRYLNENIAGLTSEMLSDCCIENVVNSILDTYSKELADAKSAKGSNLTQKEIQDVVNSVNNTQTKPVSLKLYGTEPYSTPVDLLGGMFDAESFVYTVNADAYLEGVHIAFEKLTDNQTVSINGQEADEYHGFTLNELSDGANTFDVKFVSGDKQFEQVYRIVLIKQTDSTVKNKNIYFADGLSGYNCTASGEYLNGNMILAGVQASTLEAAEAIKLKSGARVKFKLRGASGTVKAYAKNQNGEKEYIKNVTLGADSEAEYIAKEDAEFVFGIEFDSTIMICEFTVSHNDDNAELKSIAVDKPFRIIPAVADGIRKYTVILDDAADTVNLTVLPKNENAEIVIGDSYTTDKQINLDFQITEAAAAVTAEAGNKAEYIIKIVRPYSEIIDVPDGEALNRIKANPLSASMEDLLLCKIYSVYENMLDKYRAALSEEQSELTQQLIQTIINNENKLMETPYYLEDAALGENQRLIHAGEEGYVSCDTGVHTGVFGNGDCSVSYNDVYAPVEGLYIIKVLYKATQTSAENYIRITANETEYTSGKVRMSPEKNWCSEVIYAKLDKGINRIVITSDNKDIMLQYITVEKFVMPENTVFNVEEILVSGQDAVVGRYNANSNFPAGNKYLYLQKEGAYALLQVCVEEGEYKLGINSFATSAGAGFESQRKLGVCINGGEELTLKTDFTTAGDPVTYVWTIETKEYITVNLKAGINTIRVNRLEKNVVLELLELELLK